MLTGKNNPKTFILKILNRVKIFVLKNQILKFYKLAARFNECLPEMYSMYSTKYEKNICLAMNEIFPKNIEC